MHYQSHSRQGLEVPRYTSYSVLVYIVGLRAKLIPIWLNLDIDVGLQGLASQ